MFMPIATYAFLAQADQASHFGGADVRTACGNVTLAERHAR
jgi:hypothetical protein